MRNWVPFIPAIITAAVGLAGLLGLAKYLIEPWHSARALRRKYATALWIACSDLHIHLDRIRERVKLGDVRTTNALKKIPRYDWGKRADWFAKEGYYTTATAYKIAALSAWLRIYQRELLFLPYAASQSFLSKLYVGADELKSSLSTGTCFWYDYVDAVGDGLSQLSAVASGRSPVPMSFAEFCQRYATDHHFLSFYDQVHMYIHFIGERKPPYLESVDRVLRSLEGLMGFLESQKLLPGFKVKRPEISREEMARSVERPTAPGAQPS